MKQVMEQKWFSNLKVKTSVTFTFSLLNPKTVVVFYFRGLMKFEGCGSVLKYTLRNISIRYGFVTTFLIHDI